MKKFIYHSSSTIFHNDRPQKIESIGWDHESWIKAYNHADRIKQRELLKEVYKCTIEICENGSYITGKGAIDPNEDGIIHFLGDVMTDGNEEKVYKSFFMDNYTKYYSKPFTANFDKLTVPAKIEVVSEDCLVTAEKWVKQGIETTVLNMANRQCPGGSVLNGAHAQEEYLFRCSNYYRSLYRFSDLAGKFNIDRAKESYPLDRNYGGIFTPDATVFRGSEETGYKLLENPWRVNFIAVAAMRNPETEIINHKKRIIGSLVEGARNKIRTIFRIAADNGQRNLVLGALGCGAFHNPPEHIAELFRNVLCEQEFAGAFERITFSVLNDYNSNGDSNFTAFKTILDGFVPPMG